MRNLSSMRTEPQVAIILVNYNSYDYTVACVHSLQEIDYENYEIIIVDNASSDNSFERLKKLENKNIHVLKSKINGGFAYGNNIGIKYAISCGFKFFLLLNNDTIVTKGFLRELVNTSTKYDSDITTCQILYESDKNNIWYAGGELDWINQRAIHNGLNKAKQSEAIERKVSFVSGCCMLINMKCIEQVGYISEDYFMYYEDLDYCYSATLKGLSMYYTSKGIIYHCVSASGGGENSPFYIEWSNRSRRKFYRKYMSEYNFLTNCIALIKSEFRSIAKILCEENRRASICAYIKSFKIISK